MLSGTPVTLRYINLKSEGIPEMAVIFSAFPTLV
jgi:hypothetical protein